MNKFDKQINHLQTVRKNFGRRGGRKRQRRHGQRRLIQVHRVDVNFRLQFNRLAQIPATKCFYASAQKYTIILPIKQRLFIFDAKRQLKFYLHFPTV